MRSLKGSPKSGNVIESLVHTLMDCLTATLDLYKTLRVKEKKDHEDIKRLKGYPGSCRRSYYDSDDTDSSGEESIIADKTALYREFERGLDELGPRFAVGDVITQTELQAQLIILQSVLISTFLYGPTSSHPISHHLSTILTASRTASTTAINALAAQHHRMLAVLSLARPLVLPPSPQSPFRGTLPPTSNITSSASASTAPIATKRSSPPTSNSTHHTPSRPLATRSDTESTSLSRPTPIDSNNAPHSLYCLYALDLQNHPSQPLSPFYFPSPTSSSTITTTSSTPTFTCPHCTRTLNLTPNHTWELHKDDGRRVFLLGNRFVVKCHQSGPGAGYSCVLCSREGSVDTVCGDVRALVQHVWKEHSAGELVKERDVVEIEGR